MEAEIDLEKVPGSTIEERQHWAKVFQEEQEAKNRGQEFDESLPRMAALRVQTVSTLADLEKSLPITLLEWATGKQPRKAVDDLRRSISKYRDLIADCGLVPSLIEERRPAIGNKVAKADNARDQIQERFKKAETK